MNNASEAALKWYFLENKLKMKNQEKDDEEDFEPKRVLYEKLNDWENYDR